MNAEKNIFKPTLKNYDFCLFRIPKEGRRAIWEITNRCNYSCSYCIFAANKGKVSGELNTNEVFEVLERLKSKNFTHLKFTGGEPFIRKDFPKILEKSSDLDFIVDVSTNASLITKEKARKIKDYNLEMVHVSVDGHNKQLNEIARGENTYQRTINGIKNLVDNDIYVRIGTVIFKENETYLEEMVKSANSMKVNEIIFSFMEPIGRMEGDYSKVSRKTINQVKEEVQKLTKKYSSDIKINYSFTENTKPNHKGTCPGFDKFLYIDNLGRISPCTWLVDKYPEYRTESVKNKSFNELMKSQTIKAYLSYAQKCQGCPVKKRN